MKAKNYKVRLQSGTHVRVTVADEPRREPTEDHVSRRCTLAFSEIGATCCASPRKTLWRFPLPHPLARARTEQLITTSERARNRSLAEPSLDLGLFSPSLADRTDTNRPIAVDQSRGSDGHDGFLSLSAFLPPPSVTSSWQSTSF